MKKQAFYDILNSKLFGVPAVFLKAIFATVILISPVDAATTYYVATTGKDSNPGTLNRPFQTIQKASDIMQPGDTVLVRGGVYRETIRPPRGGTSENSRITYKAYPGETPIVKGSERITSWINLEAGIWKVEIPDAFFGTYNPYKLNLSGAFLWAGQENHLGEVFLDGEPLKEFFLMSDLSNSQNTGKSWFTSHSGSITSIYANFGTADPNARLAEIAVRECVFIPAVEGLSYLTIDGLTLEQNTANWCANNNIQRGIISTYGAYAIIIQNCHIHLAKTVGIACSPNTGSLYDIETYGHHIVKNNLIERCNQSGINGHGGIIAGLIEGNLIQDINYRHQMGGAESAGIKLHYAIDVIIRNNIIRRTYPDVNGKRYNFDGIWLDWAGQGTRITGNVIYDILNAGNARVFAIFLEANHGPTLIDNNIFIGGNICISSERNVIVHNLFVNSFFKYLGNDKRSPEYWVPHTRKLVEKASLGDSLTGDRYFNNIFINDTISETTIQKSYKDFRAGNNIYFKKSTELMWDNTGLVQRDYDPFFTRSDLIDGIKITFTPSDAPSKAQCSVIDFNLIGRYTFARQEIGQGIETHDGLPITINKDIFGVSRSESNPAAGPFEKLQYNMKNTFIFYAGPR